MPHTKSKAQTRARGTTIPSRASTRKISTGVMMRTAQRRRERELPLRGPNVVGARQRNQAERAYAGDTRQRFEVARGRRLASQEAENRYGRGPKMADALQRKARNEGRRPKKVAASTHRPRTKLGRAPARR